MNTARPAPAKVNSTRYAQSATLLGSGTPLWEDGLRPNAKPEPRDRASR
jgi:hypothetical protein